VREQLYFHKEQQLPFLSQLIEETAVEEAVILSTCNRTELYIYRSDNCTEAACRQELQRRLHAFQQLEEPLGGYFYTHSNDAAVRHLLRVAAGLESMALGENQILGQVKEAYSLSATGGCTGSILNRLFHKAFEAGKRVRSETALSCGASSVSYIAAELARQKLEELESRRVLLIGAGETGEQMLQSLAERGCRSLAVTNRTYRRAYYLAQRYDAEAVDYRERLSALQQTDIAVVSTASPEPVFRRRELEQLAGEGGQLPALIIDISVPRNIEAATGELDGVTLYSLDDLRQLAAENHRRRREEAEQAAAIVAEVAEEFSAWLTSLNLQPAIRAVKEKVGALHERELAGLKERLPENEYARVEEFSRYLEEKWVKLIAGRLRSLSEGGENLDYIELARRLFDGDGSSGETHDERG